MVPLMHRHKFGEILYLLSGSGTDTTNGHKSALSADRALVIPAGTYHSIAPGPNGVTVLSVQFTDTTAAAWEPKNFKGPSACRD